MKHFIVSLILIFTLLMPGLLGAQDKSVSPSSIITGKFLGESPALRDLPRLTEAEYQEMVAKAEKKMLNPALAKRSYPFANSALPKGPDPVWQRTMGAERDTRAPIQNFDGFNCPGYPPDPNGTMGQEYYMQTINLVYSIYNRAGSVVAGPGNLNTLFAGVPGSETNSGDPVVLYDEQADRYMVAVFSLPPGENNDRILIAVTTTNDPTGTWYRYSFDVGNFPDYPKFGIWRDGYYMGINRAAGEEIYVFQRSQMLTGGTAMGVGFVNLWRPGIAGKFMCVPPLDNDGAFAPVGEPGLFIGFNDDGISGGTDQLWIYELQVDWATPANSTFTRTQQLAVASFDSNFGINQLNISQMGTSMKLDAIPMLIMNPPQYRNFGSYETIVCCHTVDVDNTDHAGIRWYELRRPTGGTWSVRQQGTYAPDGNSRWMGSIMLNGSNEIALGYSISGSNLYPGIRYCGQSSAAYSSGNGILDVSEQVIQNGEHSQKLHFRWGDYSGLQVDPSDDETFWYTSEYIGPDSLRKSKIANFQIGPLLLTANFFASSTNPQVNTTVNFTDVSFGGATSWSWSISPGTFIYVGGTSASSQNPQVQFTAAGNYTITLTVSDGSGNDIKTKTNYISAIVCNALTLPISEDFSDGVAPSCWIIRDNQGNNQVWRFNNPGGRTINTTTASNGFAMLDSYMYGAGNTQNTDLITPVLNFSANNDVNILFEHYFKSAAGSTGTLSYSIDGGNTWTVLQTWTEETGNPAYFNRDVSNQVRNQANVRFKWTYTGTHGNYWAIDDISFSNIHTTLWTGGNGNHNWNDTLNWDNHKIPTGANMVAIPADAPMWPEINGNFTVGLNCTSLTLYGAAQMSVSGNMTTLLNKTLMFTGNGQLSVGGNWTNCGSFIPGTGTIKFTGATSANVTGYSVITNNMSSYVRSTFTKGMTLLSGDTIGPTGLNGNVDKPLGFIFNYLGTPYSLVHICANGWLSMNTGFDGSLTNAYLFSTNTPNATIAPWFDYLNDDIETYSKITYKTEGSAPFRVFVAQWTRLKTYYRATASEVTARISFQAKLFETTNIIEFHYGSLEPGTHWTNESASIGIEDAAITGSKYFIDGFSGSYSTGNYNHKSETAWDSLSNYRFTPPTIAQTFYNLIVEKSSALTFNTNVTMNGNFTITSGQVSGPGAVSWTHTVKGNWSNSGTYNSGGGTVLLNGTSNQNIGGDSTTTFSNLTLNNQAGFTVQTNLKVIGTLTMTSGNINCGTNTLELGTSPASPGVLTWTAGNISGSFKRWITTTLGTPVDFPVGTATSNRNLRITFSNQTANGSLTAKFEPGDPGNNSGFPLNENSLTFNAYDLYTEGTWTLVPTTLASTNYALELTGTSFTSAGVFDASVRILKRPDAGGAWTLNGTHVAGAPPVAKRSALSGFSRFALAYICGTHATVTAGGPDTVCQSPSPVPITLTGAAFGGSATNAAWSITSLNPTNDGSQGTLSTTSPTTTPASVTYTPPAGYAGLITLTLTSDDPAGSCTPATGTRRIVVASSAKVSGSFTYYNAANTPLNSGITVKLYQAGSQVGTDYTVSSGTYQFTDLCPGTYELRVSSSNPTDGSVNSTDALATNYWGAVPYEIQKVRFYAGDVTGSSFFINSTDALKIQSNFVYGTVFDKGPWAFWKSGETISSNSLPSESYARVTLSGSDVTANIYGLCAGDFNRSFIPGAKSSASTSLRLIYLSDRQISNNEEFDLPIQSADQYIISAISLILNFPPELIEVKDVLMDGAGGQLDWAVKNDELRIGWNSPVPLSLVAGDELLRLRLKTSPDFLAGKSFSFTLASDPLNELADDRYEVIVNAVLSTDMIEASSTGIDDPGHPAAINLTAYPNPFRNLTTISYILPFDGRMNLVIYNILGRPIATLVDEIQAGGRHTMNFDSRDLAPGVYSATLKLDSGSGVQSRTFKLVKAR